MLKTDWLDRFIAAENLPASYADIARNHFIPFAEQLLPGIKEHRASGAPMVIGINGAQGTGKTTFAKLLAGYWTEICGLNGSQISLDDFYLTKEERAARAADIHPLFATRGVPGTHDTDLALATLKQLKVLRGGEHLALPSFDKARDDRRPEYEWPRASGAQDFIIFEGWCVGARPVPDADLETPINALEQTQDPKAIWRRAVNQYLSQDYQTLWSLIDKLVFLKAPDFEAVLEWRRKQEGKLARDSGEDAPEILSPKEIANFIQFFERMTWDNLKVLPEVADHVFEFDCGHGVVGAKLFSDE